MRSFSLLKKRINRKALSKRVKDMNLSLYKNALATETNEILHIGNLRRKFSFLVMFAHPVCLLSVSLSANRV